MIATTHANTHPGWLIAKDTWAHATENTPTDNASFAGCYEMTLRLSLQLNSALKATGV